MEHMSQMQYMLKHYTRRWHSNSFSIFDLNQKTGYTYFNGLPTASEMAQLMAVGQPVLMKGAMKNHVVLQTWADMSKIVELAEKESQVEPVKKYTVYEPDVNGFVDQSFKQHSKMESLHKFLTTAPKTKSRYLLGVPDEKGQLGNSPFENKPGISVALPLAENLANCPDFSVWFPRGTKIRRNLFLNSGYSVCGAHYDTDANVYLAAKGTRRWRLCHPGQADHLRDGGMTDANRTKFHPMLNVNMKIAPLVKFLTIDVEEGDLLYVPPQWWHVVEGGIGNQPGEFSCGINWFFTVELTGHIPDTYLEDVRSVSEDAFSSPLAKRLKAAVDEDEKESGRENPEPGWKLRIYGAIIEADTRIRSASYRR